MKCPDPTLHLTKEQLTAWTDWEFTFRHIKTDDNFPHNFSVAERVALVLAQKGIDCI